MPQRARAMARGRLAPAIAALLAAVASLGLPAPAVSAPMVPPPEQAAPKDPPPAPRQEAAKSPSAPGKEDEEVRLGRQVAAQIDALNKLVKDPEKVARLTRIGRDVTAVCEEPGYKYTFKILDEDDVNAFSLPGGFVYFTKGILSFVRSDDELAGVMAHEVAHAAHHHVKQSLRRESEMNKQMLLGVLGAVILGGGRLETIGNVLMGAEAVKTAYLSEYSQEAELDADRAAVEYLVKCGKYNPVGVLTMMERMARDDARRSGGPAPGIFRSHPPSEARAAALEGYLKERGIPIDRMAVQDRIRAAAEDAGPDAPEAAGVRFNETVIFRTAAGTESAGRIADRLNRLVAGGLQMRDVRVADDGVTVLAGEEALFTVTAEDAALVEKAPAEAARDAARDLKRALWKIYMEQVF